MVKRKKLKSMKHKNLFQRLKFFNYRISEKGNNEKYRNLFKF